MGEHRFNSFFMKFSYLYIFQNYIFRFRKFPSLRNYPWIEFLKFLQLITNIFSMLFSFFNCFLVFCLLWYGLPLCQIVLDFQYDSQPPGKIVICLTYQYSEPTEFVPSFQLCHARRKYPFAIQELIRQSDDSTQSPTCAHHMCRCETQKAFESCKSLVFLERVRQIAMCKK